MYKAYKNDFDHSYVIGIYPVLELVDYCPEKIRVILISESYEEKDRLMDILDKKEISYQIDDKSINRISRKGNTYLIGVINKYRDEILPGNHIILDKPANMGNLGTIIRTMVGFGYDDLVITGESCDYFNPKVIRASMGAFFKVRIEKMDSIEEYAEKFKDNDIYFFMLGEESLLEVKDAGRHSLCFGNEGAGLDEGVKKFGKALMIPQSKEIDSLNLPISTGIAMFYFSQLI